MNTISFFAALPVPSTWFQLVLGMSALTLTSCFSQQWPSGRTVTIPVSLPLGCLAGLAAASIMAGIMQPELMAAAFSES